MAVDTEFSYLRSGIDEKRSSFAGKGSETHTQVRNCGSLDCNVLQEKME